MMTESDFERQAYEFPEIWEEEWFLQEDFARVEALAAVIPDESTSVLDVGCGNGLFLNYLKRKYPNRFSTLLGVDRSEAALARVQTQKIRCAGERLPLRSGQFDVVMCMEVLEHLPAHIFTQVIGEIARAAKRMIVISVPYREDLRANECVCPSCNANFHPDFHVRAFRESDLKPLFSRYSFELANVYYLAPHVTRVDHDLRNQVRALFRPKRRSSPPSYALCPQCGFHDANKLAADLVDRKKRRESAARVTVDRHEPRGIRHRVRALLPKRTRYRWMAATYRRVS